MKEKKKRRKTRKIRASPEEKPEKKKEPEKEGRALRSEKLQKIGEIIKANKNLIITGAVVLIIMSAIVLTQMPSKADLDAEIGTRTGEIAAMTNQVVAVSDDVAEIKALGALATDEDLVPVLNQTATNEENIGALETRIGTAEGNITALQDDFATVGSPPESYLSGNLTSGNLTIHAEASEAGEYTANVHLIYSRAFSFNGTYEEAQQYFHDEITWTTGIPHYQTVVSYNGTHWALGEVWWNIGTFALAADTEKTITILFGGLTDTPSFAYVEIYPALG